MTTGASDLSQALSSSPASDEPPLTQEYDSLPFLPSSPPGASERESSLGPPPPAPSISSLTSFEDFVRRFPFLFDGRGLVDEQVSVESVGILGLGGAIDLQVEGACLVGGVAREPGYADLMEDFNVICSRLLRRFESDIQAGDFLACGTPEVRRDDLVGGIKQAVEAAGVVGDIKQEVEAADVVGGIKQEVEAVDVVGGIKQEVEAADVVGGINQEVEAVGVVGGIKQEVEADRIGSTSAVKRVRREVMTLLEVIVGFLCWGFCLIPHR